MPCASIFFRLPFSMPEKPFPPRYTQVRDQLKANPRVWLVTGAAGFIGSNLVQELLGLGQTVVGLDNFATGYQSNLDDAVAGSDGSGGSFRFIEGDIRDIDACHRACDGVDLVLHQAALASVPRSIADPLSSSQVNVEGFLDVLVAARDAGIKRVVYASSSSVYGDAKTIPQVVCCRRTPPPRQPTSYTPLCSKRPTEWRLLVSAISMCLAAGRTRTVHIRRSSRAGSRNFSPIHPVRSSATERPAAISAM